MIDLSDRILQTPAPPKAPGPLNRWHPWRRALQVLCGVLLIVLPLTDGLRLDVRRGEFYFAWHRMAAHDLVLLFWVAMLGVWSLVTVSFLYGRLWCGWVCPQTLASDFADSLKRRLEKGFRRFAARRALRIRQSDGGTSAQEYEPRGAVLASQIVWSGGVLAMAMGTGVILACYWLAPHTVARATVRPWADWPAGLTVYGIAGVLAADMLWARRKFCSHACPYGALMSLLADRNTLAVRYLDERDDDCIRCGKCVTDCPMGIDIKQGVGQLSCIGCGECVDACSDVLGKRGVPGLIEFRYGVEPERAAPALTWPQRAGLWDGRRIAVVAGLFAFAGVVLWNLYGRQPLAASVVANGEMTRDAHWVRNGYHLDVANGTPDAQAYQLSVDGLPQAHVEPSSVLSVGARDRRFVLVTVAAPTRLLHAHVRAPITLRLRAGREKADVSTFFYTPAP